LPILALSMLVGGCAGSSYVSSWTSPDLSQPLQLQEAEIAVFLLAPSEATRRALETMLAQEIDATGARGVPGHTLVSAGELEDRAAVRAALAEAGVQGALVVRPVGARERTRYVPGRTYYAGSPYSSFSGYWGYGAPMVMEPGHYETERSLFVEALYFAVQDGELLWGGVSETTRPDDLERTLRMMAEDTVAEMRKTGLLAD
jgi:hypothetical protein